ncbi:fumarate reductase/succinate dehydrogenase flavoprotein [Grosmannia clavigera kw1407]|uniref:Fumarate reductase/succinate dehydrogenase flavoprotein n=1 Tax=Grosmannia clavigera (strain kw1407 / UAMH 11150) TaxID=655863 RepID=F0XGI4_GROCL|nr:fumarate reductase/succinate dehydrogenase flavoprotein [Grosmannia clavigera kw1407]EFX02678.1 fumarate reductase/succinate dehydrogenase flavoprotein [Grosmannia clavigera kw1407]
MVGQNGFVAAEDVNSANYPKALNGNPASTTFFSIGDKDEFNPEKWVPCLPPRHPETGIKVLIVGAGFAGLTAALECWRQRHTVVSILERSAGPNYSGDLIIVQPSALEMMRHWP